MLNLEQEVHNVGTPFEVVASDNIFIELGNSTYDYRDLLSELIDNSIAARADDEHITIRITLGISESNSPLNWLTVSDNASGISPDRLGSAITPAGIQTQGSLNEHGLGMKQAVAGLGELKYLATRVTGEACARVIDGFRFGTIYPSLFDTTWDHGTEIAIHNLKPVVRLLSMPYTRNIVPYLGARYRRFLTPANPKVTIIVTMVDIDRPDADGSPHTIHTWSVKEVKPHYFDPKTRTNAPVVSFKKFKGVGWEAELVFGYSPLDDNRGNQWQELGLSKPDPQSPYAVSLSRQGLDVLLNDRVIVFHQLSEVGFVEARHNSYNHIRGEIILKKGFTTAITKNSVIENEHWEQCLQEMKLYLEKEGLLKSRTYPGELPEAALRDRLARHLSSNVLAPRTDVKKEYAIEGLGGKIDVLADGEAWEIKRDEAYGLDVYQLFAYMDMGKFKKGYLLAKSFRDSAYAAKDHINGKHDVEIVLTHLEDYPINGELSASERRLYNR